MPLELMPLEKVSLSENIYNLLKEQIFQGKVGPGQKLDIHQLAKHLRVSRMPVKEALNRLANEGLLAIYPQRGTYVKDLPSPKEVRDLFSARLMMELWGARSAMKVPACSARIARVLDEYDPLFSAPAESFDYVKFGQYDRAFHATIVGAAENPQLDHIYESLNFYPQVWQIYWGRDYGRSVQSHQEHRRIAKALEQEESDLCAAITEHIKSSESYILHLFETGPSDRQS